MWGKRNIRWKKKERKKEISSKKEDTMIHINQQETKDDQR